MSKVRVHQFVLTELTRPRSQGWRVCDLFGVSHWIDAPVDTEFPYRVARMQVFTRFYLNNARATKFFVRVRWLHAPGGVAHLIGMSGPIVIPFAPDATALDCSFNLNSLQLQGVGLHRIDLIQKRKHRWMPQKWVRVAATYFVVER